MLSLNDIAVLLAADMNPGVPRSDLAYLSHIVASSNRPFIENQTVWLATIDGLVSLGYLKRSRNLYIDLTKQGRAEFSQEMASKKALFLTLASRSFSP